MALRSPRRFAELERAIGIKCKSAELFEQALTHASARSGSRAGAKPGKTSAKPAAKGVARADNERLEFIGDRVLGLAIAELLNESHPTATEGELARRYNQLVRGETCAAVARDIDLGRHLILGDSEHDNGGRAKDTILADAMEAVLGAIFLDLGYLKARDTVHRLWRERQDKQAAAVVDAKSALQEWAQGRGLDLPGYVELARSGPDHAPRFVAEVRISGTKPAQGEGASKRAAEQAAATALLSREGVWKDKGL